MVRIVSPNSQPIDPCWESVSASSSPSSSLPWLALTPTPMTTSTSMTETVNGSHLFNISGYSLLKGLASEGTDVRALFELKFLDQSEKKRHKVYSQFSRPPDSGPYTIRNRGIKWGYSHFSKRTDLERSYYLKDDCLKVDCRVGVVRSYTEGPEIYSIAVPPSNVGQNLGHLSETGRGTDVNSDVDGETFAVHSEGHRSGPSQQDNEGGSRSRGRRSSRRHNGGGSRSRGTGLSRRRTSTLSGQRTLGPSTPSNEDENNQLGQFLAEQRNLLYGVTSCFLHSFKASDPLNSLDQA
ncbi:hypothetical protein SO802_022612 [Lithocarpus litseifolius]|uniref:MATH domain-containing protein n=1 Tax=Lithocarpus litseifolius TaxID=425828 RepID=A0AAW2C703_9ROSI